MIHIVIGVVLTCLGVLGLSMWWEEFGEVLQGSAPFLLVLVGLSGIGAGLRELTFRWARSEPRDLSSEA